MTAEAWRPTARLARLEQRAALFARVRAFFAARGVMEVDTPVLVNHAVSDVHIHSARVELAGGAVLYLHTSPEYAMKRLLAAGSGDIFQICHVVRGFERSPLHNSEFTLLEWYRMGYALKDLMAEVEALLREVAEELTSGTTEQVSYRDAFLAELALDPFTASTHELTQAAELAGFVARDNAHSRDDLLDCLMACRVGPNLGRNGLTFVYAYPASQAALARLDPHDARASRPTMPSGCAAACRPSASTSTCSRHSGSCPTAPGWRSASIAYCCSPVALCISMRSLPFLLSGREGVFDEP